MRKIFLSITFLFLILSHSFLNASPDRVPVIWTGLGDGTTWSDPANWNSNPSLPGIFDDVIIDLAGSNSIDIDINVNIKSLTLLGSNELTLSASQLKLEEDSSFGPDTKFIWVGSTLRVATLTLEGRTEFIRTAPAGLLGTMINKGQFQHGSGEIVLDPGNVIDNEGSYTFVEAGDVVSTGVPRGNFYNRSTATLAKTTLGGTSIMRTNLINENGKVEVETGTLRITSTVITGGTFETDLGAILDLGSGSGDLNSFAGALSGVSEGAIQLGSNVILSENTTIDISGQGLIWGGTKEVKGPGKLVNNGILRVNGALLSTQIDNYGSMLHENIGLVFLPGGIINNFGTSELSIGADIFDSPSGSGVYNNETSGVFLLQSGDDSQIDVEFNNEGLVDIIGNTLTFTNEFTNVETDGVIAGNGKIDLSAAVVTSNGITSPGNSPGELSWIGDYNPSSSAIYEVDINDLGGAGVGHDRLRQSSGDVSLSGILEVYLADSYAPSLAGDVFEILNSTGKVSGVFSSVEGPPRAEITVQYNSNNVELRVIPAAAVGLDLKVFLAGPYAGPGMDLGLNSFIPLAQPYNIAPFNYAGSELLGSIPADMVDWVLVDLRTGTGAASQVDRKAALLKADGSITDLDGSPLEFFQSDGSYYVVVHHRIHLGIMSASAVPLSGSSSYDFTSGGGQAFGSNPMREVATGIFALWGGDGDSSGDTTASDFLSVWLPSNGGPAGYLAGDFDMSSASSAFDFLNVWLPANGQASQLP